MAQDQVSAAVSHSWIGIAIGKIEFRQRSAREKLQDAVPENAWQAVCAALDAGLVRPQDFWQVWKHRAVEWNGERFVRNRLARGFDYALATTHGIQIGALATFFVLLGQPLCLALPGVLSVVVINRYVTPHRLATQVLSSAPAKARLPDGQ